MATAQLQYRVNGGALHEDSIEVAGGDVIALTAASFAGWGTPAARWEIVAFPPGFTVPAGWSENSSARNFYYLANSGGSGVTPPSITLPLEATRWGKWLFRLTVNGTVVSSVIGVETLSPALGLHDLAVGEGSQFGGTRQWVGDHQDNERLLDAAAANAAIDEIAGAMRDALLNWPARVSGLIAADLGVEPHLVQTVLQQHVADLLTEAADRFDPPGLGNRGADR